MAVSLLMNVMHQQAPVIEAMPLAKLFVYARMACALTGRDPI